MRHIITLLFIAGSSAAGAEVPSGQVHISDFRYSGTGCEQGSVAANLSPDKQALTILFDDFVVSSEDNASGSSNKQCDLDVAINAPAGWEYSFFCVDYRGYAGLDDRVQGSMTSSVQNEGGRNMSLGSFRQTGPYDDDYSHLVGLPLDSTLWSGCNGQSDRSIKLRTSTRVTSPAPNDQFGVMTVDSVDGSIKHHYGIAWRKCPEVLEFEVDAGCMHRNNAHVNKRSFPFTLKKCSTSVNLNQLAQVNLNDYIVNVDFKYWGYNGMNKDYRRPKVYDHPPARGCGASLSDTDDAVAAGFTFDPSSSKVLHRKWAGSNVIAETPESATNPGNKWLYLGMAFDAQSSALTLTNAGNGWGRCSVKTSSGCAACISDVKVKLIPKR